MFCRADAIFRGISEGNHYRGGDFMRAGGVFKIKHNRSGATLRYGAEIAALQMPLNGRRQEPEVQRLSINEKKRLGVVTEILKSMHARLIVQRNIQDIRAEVLQNLLNPKPIRLSDQVRMFDLIDPQSYLDRLARIERKLGEKEKIFRARLRKLNAKILRRKETIQRRDG